MHYYSMGRWLLFFFFYCVVGWVWESCYVSALKHRWVNRGFLKGPWLPIYGSGALLILFTTLPVQDNLWLVFLFGMIFPTVLEYVTGYVMEKIFRVRYWDYSNQKLQIHGYICLSSTLTWGVFSVLLVRLGHPLVEKIVLRIPDRAVDPVSLVLTVLFSVDVFSSVQDALDFRTLLSQLTQEHEELQKLARRAEIISVFAEDDLKKFRERTELEKRIFQTKLLENVMEHQSSSEYKKMKRKEKMELTLRRLNEMKMDVLDAIADAVDARKEKQAENSALSAERMKERERDRMEILEKVRDYRSDLRHSRSKQYKKAFRIIRANPSATGKDYKKTLDALRKIEKDK